MKSRPPMLFCSKKVGHHSAISRPRLTLHAIWIIGHQFMFHIGYSTRMMKRRRCSKVSDGLTLCTLTSLSPSQVVTDVPWFTIDSRNGNCRPCSPQHPGYGRNRVIGSYLFLSKAFILNISKCFPGQPTGTPAANRNLRLDDNSSSQTKRVSPLKLSLLLILFSV